MLFLRRISSAALKESYPVPLYFHPSKDRLHVSLLETPASHEHASTIGSFQNNEDLGIDSFEENQSFKRITLFKILFEG